MIEPASWLPAGDLELEPNALRAVKETESSVALTAGPGAGKTELLAQRADFLLRTGLTPYPYRILAISFKRDASRNLKARVRLRCGASLAHRFDSFTFHAFGKGLIDKFRGALTGRDALERDYTIGQTRYNGSQITFEDMVPLGLQILRGCEVARNAVRQTYTHVFLDEFQDCTATQYRLIKEAFLGTEILVTAVGDTKQRIMAWAGALEGITKTFATDFGAKRLSLYQNFRSLPRLRRMQNAMVKVMEPDAAVDDATIQGKEGEVQVLAFSDEIEEAQALAEAVENWIEDEKTPPSEIAVLVRQQADLYAPPLMEALDAKSIAYRNEQAMQDLSVEPLARLIVDFLAVVIGEREPGAYSRLMGALHEMDWSNTAEDSLARWSAYIGNARTEALRSGGFSDVSVLEQLAHSFLEECGVQRLIALSPDYEQGARLTEVRDETFLRLSEFVAKGATALVALSRFSDDQAVRIMTIHKSKGLEFHSVVVLGVEHETFWGDQNEARATFFVAISRAKRRVVLTSCDTRAKPEGARRWSEARRQHAEFIEYAEQE